MSTTGSDRLRSISSRQNPLVKELRHALARGEPTGDGHCAIEGVHLIEEAIRSGLPLRAVLFSQSAEGRAQRLLPQLPARVETLVLPDAVFSSAAGTDTTQGVAALVKLRAFELDDLVRVAAPLVLVAAGVQDPGNLGTMLRSAEAFGASGAILGEGTASHFNAKVVRASAGSIFRLPLVRAKLAETVEALRARGLKLLAASAHRGKPLDETDLLRPVALFIGNEGAGIARDLVARMDELIVIPHSPRVESLNAAMAASILLYEAARQRRLVNRA